MGRVGKVGGKPYSKRRIRSRDKRLVESDESDEDYTVGDDEVFNESEEYCSSFAGDESEESLGEFEGEEDEEEEQKVRKIGRAKGQKIFPGRKKNEVGKARKRRRASYKIEDVEDSEDEDFDVDVDDDDDDDDDVDDDDDDVDVVVDEEEEEEFTPDEIDLEDEDELAVMKKHKKVSRPSLRKKGVVKGKKRKRSSRVMKKRTRKNPTKSRLRRKSAPGNDRASTEKNRTVKERSKENSGRRKRKFMADSDSDFMSSRSSDFEHTISEEEREQVREASEFCRNLTTSLRSSSLVKTPQEGVSCHQRRRPGRKDKQMAQDLKKDAGNQVCGICLSEEGKMTVRGTLNCCSHFFCFACIFEWSKVESRCPLCKQRFVTISKPTRSNAGFGLRTIMIQVPERDQVYQPSEEELRGYLDPYDNVICTECQQGGDDALMLLCDICDSPAHTYCVGLGREVPEGNWYCEGCRPTALGFSNPQGNPLHDQRRTNLSGSSTPNENVREAIDLNLEYVPETPLTQGTGVFSSPRRVGDSQAVSLLSGMGASTVSRRRRMRQFHHIVTNRMSQLGGRTNGMSATSGNNHLGSRTEWGWGTAFQHASTPQRLASQQNFSQGRLQDNFIPSVQSRDLFPATSSHSRDQLIRGQTSTSGEGSVNRMPQAGLAGINSGINSGINTRLGYEQLHPCSNRSSIADDSMSPYGYREATVPSRTSRGTLHTPF
ncbi:PHD and RING finger domain-containing protein [Actinidia chinensis var. chinensis]|uniref:PHD and RING finger domain-containing protein n=1 Tax=Actinidia chinensis var. chinensis TaxID=1590841 RepID=A0A2R6Q730_ACTCC|nr:PHD and RING finger domain-containing protein [Actinidia chinensis var. chinensis]